MYDAFIRIKSSQTYVRQAKAFRSFRNPSSSRTFAEPRQLLAQATAYKITRTRLKKKQNGAQQNSDNLMSIFDIPVTLFWCTKHMAIFGLAEVGKANAHIAHPLAKVVRLKLTIHHLNATTRKYIFRTQKRKKSGLHAFQNRGHVCMHRKWQTCNTLGKSNSCRLRASSSGCRNLRWLEAFSLAISFPDCTDTDIMSDIHEILSLFAKFLQIYFTPLKHKCVVLS